MKQLRLSADLALPIDAVTQTFAFLARRGGGKTYGAGKLAEEMLQAGAQVVVFDPVGNWYGLRLAADGRSPGIEIPVFGGEHGDIPLEVGGGAIVANLVVDTGTSLILDVSLFRKHERKTFMTAFAEQLFHRKKTARSAMHLIVEEAQMFAPQRIAPDEARMLGAMEDIIKLGRNYGIGASLLSQRPQAVNKDVLSQTECLVVLQTSGAHERKAIEAWVEDNGLDAEKGLAEAMREIPGLPRGTAWVWSPQWLRVFKRVKIGRKWTFDASATPEAGAKIQSVRKLAPVDLERVRHAMAETIEKANQNDPAALRRTIALLQTEIQRNGKSVTPVKIKVVDDETLARLENAVATVQSGMDDLRAELRVCEQATEAIVAAMKSVPIPLAQPSWIAASSPRRIDRDSDAGKSLNKGAREMLRSLASRHPIPLSRRQVATLSGLSPNSGTFSNYLSSLRVSGFMTEDSKGMHLTDVGFRFLGDDIPEAPRTTRELVEMWKSKLQSGARRMLDVLVKCPVGMTRDQLADASGISAESGTFSNYLSSLRANGLLESRDDMVFPDESLFPLGR